jgi:GMP synthase-like glutamine amidotransferase
VRVGLLECDHVPPDLRAIGDDYAPMFEAAFTAHASWVHFDRVDVVGGAELPSLGEHDAYLITGSRHSAYEDLPWMSQLGRFVGGLVDAEVPVVGVCFGHQLLAHHLDGEVKRAEVGWGVGVHEAQVLAPQAWMTPAADRFRLIVSHQDQVVRLPDDATLLATSDHAPVAAFRIGSAVGFQGHPEFTRAYASALMAARRHRIPGDVIERGEATLSLPTDTPTVTSWLGRFLAGH